MHHTAAASAPVLLRRSNRLPSTPAGARSTFCIAATRLHLGLECCEPGHVSHAGACCAELAPVRLLRWAPDGAYLLTAPQGQAGFSLWSTRDWSQVPHPTTNSPSPGFSGLCTLAAQVVETACQV